jgi:phosphoribosylamine---glycine ligase
MNILLIGSGGREHALAWKMAQSKHLTKLFIAPGNGGTSQCGVNVPILPGDFHSLKEFILRNQISLVVVGPEEPLVNGIVDFFLKDPELARIPVIGPAKDAARLEGSKDFAKQFMQRNGIPTAAYKTFTKASVEEGLQFIRNATLPLVLKADGLAAGKGVVICESCEEAEDVLLGMLTGCGFGKASEKVVIEEFLKGIELSVFILSDGKSYKILPEAKDYKKIGAGDSGPNTGGMGSVSPVPFADKAFMEKVERKIIAPTMKGLQDEGIPYQGFLFFGLIKVEDEPFLIEYNCRLGDPESESVLPRISNDLVDLFLAVKEQRLSDVEIRVDPRHAATVMLVSKGYPGIYEKGKEITGLDRLRESLVFHAGTEIDPSGKYLTDGGRVIAVTTLADTAKEALARSYFHAGGIDFEGKYFRKDIGFDL